MKRRGTATNTAPQIRPFFLPILLISAAEGSLLASAGVASVKSSPVPLLIGCDAGRFSSRRMPIVPTTMAIRLRIPAMTVMVIKIGGSTGFSPPLNALITPAANAGIQVAAYTPAPQRTSFRLELLLRNAPAAASMIPRSTRNPYSSLRPPPVISPKPTTMSTKAIIPKILDHNARLRKPVYFIWCLATLRGSLIGQWLHGRLLMAMTIVER